MLGWPLKTFPIVEVTWEDSTSWHTWNPIEDAAKLRPDGLISIGYLVKQTKKHIVIAQTLGYDDQKLCGKGCGYFVIPAGCIKKQRIITWAIRALKEKL